MNANLDGSSNILFRANASIQPYNDGIEHASPSRVGPAALNRRRALEWLGGAVGAVLVGGCGAGGEDSGITATSSSSSSSSSSSATGCTLTDALTGGPYPGDGSNSDDNGTLIDVLADAGIIRSNITADIAGTNVQSGISLQVTINLSNLNNNCAAVAGYYVYIWQCNKNGVYSAYKASTNGGGTNYEGTTFLRGVQLTDSNGQAQFTTIFPGRYSGRVNHIHMEIYSGSNFTTANKVLTTQFCFPDTIDSSVDSAYSNTNSASLTNATDAIFSSNYASMMFTVSGDSSGYAATVDIGLAL